MGLNRLFLLLAGNIHCGRAVANTHSNTDTDANTHANTNSYTYRHANTNSYTYRHANTNSYTYRHANTDSDTHACADTVRHQRREPHHLYAAGKSQF
jgi:hypothetical protein